MIELLAISCHLDDNPIRSEVQVCARRHGRANFGTGFALAALGQAPEMAPLHEGWLRADTLAY
jgi:hypothetical protein